MEKTGTWIWPDRYSSLKIIEVKSTDIEYIKSLVVGWDVTELGAPAFMTKAGEKLYDVFEEEPEKEDLLNLFINQAILTKDSNTYSNPLVGNKLEKDIIEDALYGFPDKEIQKQISTQETIILEITNTLQKLWDTAHLEAYGFNPKRGFRLSNLKELIDPKSELSKSAITKQRKQYKALLFQYLQLFVQNADIETGFYHSYDGINWKKGKDYGIAEEYTLSQWWLQINTDYLNEISEYIDIVSSLPKLSKHLSAKQPVNYQYIADILNLDNLFKYDSDNISRADISLEEILLKLLDFFPEQKSITKNLNGYPIILLLIRIYNAQGRFEGAKKLLKDNNLYLYTENQLEFFNTKPNRYQQIAFYESCICEMISTEDFHLWRFPDYPKYTDEEIKKYDLYTGVLFSYNPEHKKKYEAEQIKIAQIIKERGTLAFDFRQFLDFTYFNNLDLIFDDLEKNNQRLDLDEIIVSIVGQIYVLMDLDIAGS